MGFWGKKKTRKNLIKADLESVHTSLEYINNTANTVAGMAAKYKKRYLMEGCEADNDFMAICETATLALKEAYEILYQIVEEKQQESTKK